MAEAKFCGSCGAFLPQTTRSEDRAANAPAEKQPPSGATGPA
jgi:hypothetical protein